MIMSYDLDLKTGNKIWIPLQMSDGGSVDAVSIFALNPTAATWDSGVVTVKKSNSQSGVPVNINGTPVTLSADGLKELALADYAKAALLCMDVTTAATGGTTILKLTVSLKRLGFALT